MENELVEIPVTKEFRNYLNSCKRKEENDTDLIYRLIGEVSLDYTSIDISPENLKFIDELKKGNECTEETISRLFSEQIVGWKEKIKWEEKEIEKEGK